MFLAKSETSKTAVLTQRQIAGCTLVFAGAFSFKFGIGNEGRKLIPFLAAGGAKQTGDNLYRQVEGPRERLASREYSLTLAEYLTGNLGGGGECRVSQKKKRQCPRPPPAAHFVPQRRRNLSPSRRPGDALFSDLISRPRRSERRSKRRCTQSTSRRAINRFVASRQDYDSPPSCPLRPTKASTGRRSTARGDMLLRLLRRHSLALLGFFIAAAPIHAKVIQVRAYYSFFKIFSRSLAHAYHSLLCFYMI